MCEHDGANLGEVVAIEETRAADFDQLRESMKFVGEHFEISLIVERLAAKRLRCESVRTLYSHECRQHLVQDRALGLYALLLDTTDEIRHDLGRCRANAVVEEELEVGECQLENDFNVWAKRRACKYMFLALIY